MSRRSRFTSTEVDLQRVTVRLDKATIDELEMAVERGEFPNRSQAIRTFLREQLQCDEQSTNHNPVYDHQEPTQ